MVTQSLLSLKRLFLPIQADLFFLLKSKFLIAPNNVDDEIKSDGRFQIPTKRNEKRYLLEAQFPNEIKKDEVTEYLIVLALKDKLESNKQRQSLLLLSDELKKNRV